MFATVISLNYIRFVGKLMIINGHFINQRIEFYLNNTMNLSSLNSTHYARLYTQDDDRSGAIDTVTSVHPIYTQRILVIFLCTEHGKSLWQASFGFGFGTSENGAL